MFEGHKFSDKTPNRSKRSHEAIHRLRKQAQDQPLIAMIMNTGCVGGKKATRAARELHQTSRLWFDEAKIKLLGRNGGEMNENLILTLKW